jgi:hypothetical protein
MTQFQDSPNEVGLPSYQVRIQIDLHRILSPCMRYESLGNCYLSLDVYVCFNASCTPEDVIPTHILIPLQNILCAILWHGTEWILRRK